MTPGARMLKSTSDDFTGELPCEYPMRIVEDGATMYSPPTLIINISFHPNPLPLLLPSGVYCGLLINPPDPFGTIGINAIVLNGFPTEFTLL